MNYSIEHNIWFINEAMEANSSSKKEKAPLLIILESK